MRKVLSITMISLGLLFLSGCVNDSFNNPNINTIKESIENIDKISDICIVTEDNDPNGNLNKQGGYTGALFFAYDDIDQTSISGDDACDKGTDAGGSIEVYANEEDANKRNDYLATFDGTALSSGYHVVEGTVVIRTSSELTATQQKELANEVIESIK